MLKELFLENFVFTSSLTIPFEKGFNVISGETGAGKTLLMQALALISGDRSDFQLIKKGCEKATIQATFEVESSSEIFSLFQENSLEISSEEYLVIKRELLSHGKTKVFINQIPVSLFLLKKLSPFLFSVVFQNMNTQLKEESFQRAFLDQDDHITKTLKEYQKIFLQEKEKQQKLISLKQQLENKPMTISSIEKQIKLLSDQDFSEETEDDLFQRYKSLSEKKEIFEQVNQILLTFSTEDQLSHSCLKYGKILDKLSAFDNDLVSLSKKFFSIPETLKEILNILESYLYSLNFSEKDYSDIENKLSHIKAIKRRFGPYQEALAHLKKITQEKDFLDHLDDFIDKTKEELFALKEKKTQLGHTLSSLRQKKASFLSEKVSKLIQALDMSYYRFHIDLVKKPAYYHGLEEVHFVLSSTKTSDHFILSKTASGGELSRILLALCLSQKETMAPTFIFDEIDANIGGETATKIGEKLFELGKTHQVICITHFPQVAKSAAHHLKLSKIVEKKALSSQIKVLTPKEKKEELIRMLGGMEILAKMNKSHPH